MSISFYSNIQYILTSEMIAETDEHELTKKRQKAWTTGPKKSPDQLQIRMPLCGFHFYPLCRFYRADFIVQALSRGFHPLCRFYREDSNVQASLRGFHHASAIGKFHSQEPTPKSDQSNEPALENQ